jgi:lipopolysaccharide/colanic/teichoic acid biosynthesis glycosyltransferase
MNLKGKRIPVCGAEGLIGGQHPGEPLSAWSVSPAKRVFDILAIALLTPVLAPLLLVIAVAVRLSSPGPVLFRQTRIGRGGAPFTILKFRTMYESASEQRDVLASAVSREITRVGRLLRWLKFDELPQLINVLRGEMSLVGPRPKLAHYQRSPYYCRPGITGPATLAFAREDIFFAHIPAGSLDDYYFEVVLPLKHEIDSAYMARATFASDLRLLLRTALRSWDAEAPIEVETRSAASMATLI